MSKRQPRLALHHQLFTAASGSEEYTYKFVGKGKLYIAHIESRNGQPNLASVYLRVSGTTAHACRIHNMRGPHWARFVCGEPIPVDDNMEIFATVTGVPTGDEIQLRVVVQYD